MKRLLMVVFTALFLVACGDSEVKVKEEPKKAEYKVIEEDDRGDSYAIRVETEATEKKELEKLTKEIKSEYKGKDAVWLWIYKQDSDELLAKARIPYNNKGQAMVGADSNDYIFEME